MCLSADLKGSRQVKLTITLPLPHKSLSPNYTVGSRGARLGKAAKIKKYRGESSFAACVAINDSGFPRVNWKEATASVTFYWRDRRRRDKDNADASLKAAWDGFVDSGLLNDDVGLTRLPTKFDYDKVNPRVEITIWQTDATV